MTKLNIYKEVKTLQSLAWQDDDLMRHDTLFEVQDKLASLALALAQDCGKTDDLVKSFPWLYTVREG